MEEGENKLSTEKFAGVQVYSKHTPGLLNQEPKTKPKMSIPQNKLTQQKQTDLTTTGCTLGECRASPAARAPRIGGAGRWWRSEGSEPHRWSGHKSTQQSPLCHGRQMRVTHCPMSVLQEWVSRPCLDLQVITLVQEIPNYFLLSEQILITVDTYWVGL